MFRQVCEVQVLPDYLKRIPVLFHERGAGRSSAERFYTYCTGAGKQIQEPAAWYLGSDDIKERLLDDVLGGPRVQPRQAL